MLSIVGQILHFPADPAPGRSSLQSLLLALWAADWSFPAVLSHLCDEIEIADKANARGWCDYRSPGMMSRPLLFTP
jgi:hypothetical protein